MKRARIIRVCFLTILMMVLMSSCTLPAGNYETQQSADNIAKVEICRIENDIRDPKLTSIVTMDEETGKQLVADIAALMSHEYFLYAESSFGGVVVYITYQNGEAEVIGWCQTAKVGLNKEWFATSHCFDHDAFFLALFRYVEPEVAEEIREYSQYKPE